MNKKIIIWMCVIALVLGLIGGQAVTFAESEREDELAGETAATAEESAEQFAESAEQFSQATINCAKSFPVFITNIIDMGNFETYWVDIFEKNMCQLDDIFELEERTDELQQDIREKYYACDTADIGELEAEYKETIMELYFVRNSVDLESGALKADEINNTLLTVNFYIATELKSKMIDKYVTDKKWVSDDVEFEEMFNNWREEYEDNIKTYIDCTNNTWEAVIDKWDELTTMFEELQPEKEDFEIEFEKKDDDADPGPKFSAQSNIKSFFEKALDERKVEEPSDYLDTQSGDIVSVFEEYVANIESYTIDVEEAELLARYELLYGSGGADISNSFIQKLRDLDKTLQETIKPLSTVYSKTYDIAKKQCNS